MTNFKSVGEAGTMPGTSGFTMAVFKAEDVPVGTALYVVTDALVKDVEKAAGDWVHFEAPERHDDPAMAEAFKAGARWANAKQLAPVDVYKVLKRYEDGGRLDGDYISQLARDIAALTS